MCDRHNIQDKLTDLFFGELSAEEAENVHAHIAECDECREMYEELRETVGCLEPLSSNPEGLTTKLSDDRREAILSAAREIDANSEAPEPIPISRFPFMRVAALLLVTFGTAIFLVRRNTMSKRELAQKDAITRKKAVESKQKAQNSTPVATAGNTKTADKGSAEDEKKRSQTDGLATKLTEPQREPVNPKPVSSPAERTKEASGRTIRIPAERPVRELEKAIEREEKASVGNSVGGRIEEEATDDDLDQHTTGEKAQKDLLKETLAKREVAPSRRLRPNSPAGNGKLFLKKGFSDEPGRGAKTDAQSVPPILEKPKAKSARRNRADAEHQTQPLNRIIVHSQPPVKKARKAVTSPKATANMVDETAASRQTLYGTVTDQRATANFQISKADQPTFKRLMTKVAQLETRKAPTMLAQKGNVLVNGAPQDVAVADRVTSLLTTKRDLARRYRAPGVMAEFKKEIAPRGGGNVGDRTSTILPQHQALPHALHLSRVTFSAALSRIGRLTGLEIVNKAGRDTDIISVQLTGATTTEALSLICDALHVHYTVVGKKVVILPGPKPSPYLTVLYRLSDAQLKRFKLTRDEASDKTLHQALKNQGVSLKPGSSIAYDPCGIMVVHALPNEVNQIEKILK